MVYIGNKCVIRNKEQVSCRRREQCQQVQGLTLVIAGKARLAVERPHKLWHASAGHDQLLARAR
jgi:hypothetical protein